MKMPRVDLNKFFHHSERAEDSRVGSGDMKVAGRRRQGDIISNDTNNKLSLDRRAANSDRRIDTDPSYNGPARRHTIDRRLNLKDRRVTD